MLERRLPGLLTLPAVHIGWFVFRICLNSNSKRFAKIWIHLCISNKTLCCCYIRCRRFFSPALEAMQKVAEKNDFFLKVNFICKEKNLPLSKKPKINSWKKNRTKGSRLKIVCVLGFFCCVLFYFSVQLVINFLLAFDIFHALLLLLLLRCCCFKLSFFGVLFCAAQSIIGGRAREGKNESGRQRVRERAKGREASAISAFPAKWSKQFAIDFFVCYCYSFFYNFSFNYTNVVRTKERRKKKKQETRKIKIANWRRRQRNAT